MIHSFLIKNNTRIVSHSLMDFCTYIIQDFSPIVTIFSDGQKDCHEAGARFSVEQVQFYY